MNELIKINKSSVGDSLVSTVDAKELHKFLTVGTKFKDWFPRRVEEFGFTEGVDFTSSFLRIEDGGSGMNEYHISLDMAKELAMVERNEKGTQVR